MAHLVLTIGDPTGVGPEITAKTLNRLKELPACQLTVIGSLDALRKAAGDLKLSLPQNGQIEYQVIESKLPGTVAYHSVEKAVRMIAAQEADALVTGPISKRNLHASGNHFDGHTEILEELSRHHFGLTDVKAEMLFVFNKLRLLLLTRHIPLHKVPQALARRDKVEQAFSILIGFLHNRLGIAKPRLAILGANPHAGETGGTEEKDVLVPLLEDIQNAGMAECLGPFAADAFFRSLDPQNSGFDAIIAAYHDQGLIPFKMLAGYQAVNVTIGLPFIRTSVSHGTAEDIAGKGIASEESLMAAIRTALEIIGK
jgi:4-hydroxythreonine-4-phosphate dehydrogenase